jgi:hypothetical protein
MKTSEDDKDRNSRKKHKSAKEGELVIRESRWQITRALGRYSRDLKICSGQFSRFLCPFAAIPVFAILAFFRGYSPSVARGYFRIRGFA